MHLFLADRAGTRSAASAQICAECTRKNCSVKGAKVLPCSKIYDYPPTKSIQ